MGQMNEMSQRRKEPSSEFVVYIRALSFLCECVCVCVYACVYVYALNQRFPKYGSRPKHGSQKVENGSRQGYSNLSKRTCFFSFFKFRQRLNYYIIRISFGFVLSKLDYCITSGFPRVLMVAQLLAAKLRFVE